MWRRDSEAATLDDVVELLAGIGTTLMEISATLESVEAILKEGNDDDAYS